MLTVSGGENHGSDGERDVDGLWWGEPRLRWRGMLTVYGGENHG